MDNDKVNEALRGCEAAIDKQDGIVGIRKSGPAKRCSLPAGYAEMLGHVRWMIAEASSWSAARLEKKMRWLGFVQGVLWAEGIQSIEEAERQNMPADVEFDDTHLSPSGK